MLLLASLATAAEAGNPSDSARHDSDALTRCSEFTRLSNDPEVMKKPWSENVFYRYASWTMRFVTGASSVDPGLPTTSAADTIRFVANYCVAHPEASIGEPSKRYVDTLKRQHRPNAVRSSG